MQQICLKCHTEPPINQFYAEASRVIDSTNGLVREATSIMDGLRRDGLLTADALDEPIKYRYFDLWHYYGRTAKHGAFMGGADFVQWHGYYEIVARLAEIKRSAAELRERHARSPHEPAKPEPAPARRRRPKVLAANRVLLPKRAGRPCPDCSSPPAMFLPIPWRWRSCSCSANISFLAVDVAIAHSADAFAQRAEWVPVVFSLLAAAALLAAAILAGSVRPPLPPWANHPDRAIGTRQRIAWGLGDDRGLLGGRRGACRADLPSPKRLLPAADPAQPGLCRAFRGAAVLCRAGTLGDPQSHRAVANHRVGPLGDLSGPGRFLGQLRPQSDGPCPKRILRRPRVDRRRCRSVCRRRALGGPGRLRQSALTCGSASA